MRNRFVSDYIREATGKVRTPKQVGSRLQQLRETCKDSESRYYLIRLLNLVKSQQFSSSNACRL